MGSGSENTCPKCGGASEWRGPCQRCVDAFDARLVRLERTQAVQRAVWQGYLFPGWRVGGWELSDPDVEIQSPDSWDMLRNWDGSTNLFLWGAPGVGKTYAAQLALNEIALTRGLPIAAESAAAMVHELNRFGREWHTSRILAAPYMLLDDVDKVSWSSAAIDAILHVLDRREKIGGRTILTANVAPQDFVAVVQKSCPAQNSSMAGAILDRLNPCTKVEFIGESHRRQLKQGRG